MTQREFDKLDRKLQKELLNKIQELFEELNLKLPEPKYDSNGNVVNWEAIEKALGKWYKKILYVWENNWRLSKKYSVSTMLLIKDFTNSLKEELNINTMNKREWKEIINSVVTERMRKVKIKTVIRKNAKIFSNRIQNKVREYYRQGKSMRQTEKMLKNEIYHNMWKARQVARTERNYYKSDAILKGIEGIEHLIIKQWKHSDLVAEPRKTHEEADGQIADKNGYFTIGGLKTKAPQHFGIAGEDINCMCSLVIKIKEN